MLRNRLFRTAVTASAIMLMSPSLYAETDGGYAGANFGGIIGGRNIDKGFTYEPVIGYQLNPYTSLQFSGLLGTRDNYWAMAESVFKLPLGDYITPFVLIGGGYTHLGGNSGGATAGAGINVNITPQLSLTPQYKYVQTFRSGTPRAQVLSLGLTFYLNSPEDSPTPSSTRKGESTARYSNPGN